MSWARPDLLWLLAALLLLAGVNLLWRRRVLAMDAAVGAGVPHLTSRVSRTRVTLRALLLWGGLGLGLCALAGPRWGASDELHRSSGCDLLVVLDCSRSMLANDLYPTRIEAARRKAIDLLRLAPETRMALMPFAAMPVLRCPLTGDHDALAEMLQDCSPDLFPAESGYQGTAIGDAVLAGIRVLGKQSDRGQAILVMSDGADEDKAAVAAAAAAAKDAGIPVYGLFFADPQRTVSLVIDGKKEVMDSDRTTLDTLAQTIHDHLVSHVTQLPWEEHRRVVMSERYLWLLLPGIALLAVGSFLSTRRSGP